MTIITIPKELIQEKELVLIPRREFEELVRLAKKARPEIELNSVQKKTLQTARNNKKKNNFYTLHELKTKLDLKH